MRFAHWNFIFAFSFIFALAFFYFWAFKLRRKAEEKFAQKELLKELLFRNDPFKQRLKAVLLILGVLFSLFALMRPQWGFHWQEVKRKGLDILIAVDTSKSMLAEDIKPNRLERSKLAVRDLLNNLRGDRIGLIAFSGSAFLQCPLTVDYNGFLISLDALDIDSIPKGGTSISAAIKEAVSSYEGGVKKYKVLVIITDGEDHGGDIDGVIEEAKKEGIVVFCIGIGTKEGDLIPVRQDDGRKAYLKDRNGNVVKSRLDESILQKIALSTGGSYIRATSREFGLNLIYREKLSKMEKREIEGKMSKHYEERFQIPLAIALLLFLLEPLVGSNKRIKDDENGS